MIRSIYVSPTNSESGLRSLLSRPTTECRENGEEFGCDFFDAFLQDQAISAFAAHFCKVESSIATASTATEGGSVHSEEVTEYFKQVLYHCLTEEKPELISMYLSFLQTSVSVRTETVECVRLSNFRLLLELMKFSHHQVPSSFSLASSSPTPSWYQSLANVIEPYMLQQLNRLIESYFSPTQASNPTSSSPSSFYVLLCEYIISLEYPSTAYSLSKFGQYLTFYNIPTPIELQPLQKLLLSKDQPVSMERRYERKTQHSRTLPPVLSTIPSLLHLSKLLPTTSPVALICIRTALVTCYESC